MATPVIIVISDYWLVGNVPSTDRRIQDVLRDEGSDYVSLHDVQVHSTARQHAAVATLSQTLTPKSRIELVILPESKHEAPTKRMNNLSPRECSHVFVTVGTYRVEGKLHLPSLSNNPTYTLSNQIGRFFAVTEAMLKPAGPKPLKVPVLFVNRDHLGCFSLGEPKTTAANGATEQEPLVAQR